MTVPTCLLAQTVQFRKKIGTSRQLSERDKRSPHDELTHFRCELRSHPDNSHRRDEYQCRAFTQTRRRQDTTSAFLHVRISGENYFSVSRRDAVTQQKRPGMELKPRPVAALDTYMTSAAPATSVDQTALVRTRMSQCECDTHHAGYLPCCFKFVALCTIDRRNS